MSVETEVVFKEGDEVGCWGVVGQKVDFNFRMEWSVDAWNKDSLIAII
jgi:hypothetical protein